MQFEGYKPVQTKRSLMALSSQEMMFSSQNMNIFFIQY